MCDPLWTNKCGLCGSLMVPDTQVSDAMCQLQLLSNFFIPVSSLPCFLLICLAAVECNKNHIGRDTLLDSSMKLPRCLTLSTAIFEQTLKIISTLYRIECLEKKWELRR